MFLSLHNVIDGRSDNGLEVFRQLCNLTKDELEWCISSLGMDIKGMEYEDAYNLLWVLIMLQPGVDYVKGLSWPGSIEGFCEQHFHDDNVFIDGIPQDFEDVDIDEGVTAKLSAKQCLDLIIASSSEELLCPPFVAIEYLYTDDNMIPILEHDKKFYRSDSEGNRILKDIYESMEFMDELFFPYEPSNRVVMKKGLPKVESVDLFIALFIPEKDESLWKMMNDTMEKFNSNPTITEPNCGDHLGRKFVGKYKQLLEYNVARYRLEDLTPFERFLKY